MLTYLKQAGNMPGIAASALCTFKIPVQNNHHGLHLNCLSAAGVALTQAQLINDIQSVTITLTTNSGVAKIIDHLTPTEILFLMNNYPDLGRQTSYVNAGDLYIPFSRPGRVRLANMALSLGMKDVQNYNLEIQLTAGLATLATMQIIPEVDYEPLRPLGEHVQMRLETRAFGVIAVEQYIDAPHNEPGIGLLATHIGLGTAPGVVGDVTVEAGNLVMYDALNGALNNKILSKRGLTPQVGFFHIDYTRNFDFLPSSVIKSLVYRINWTTAPVSYRMVHEVLAGIGSSNV